MVEHYASNVAVETNNLAEYPHVYILDDTHLAANIEHFNNYENTSLYSQLEFDSELASCTLKHLRLLKHQGKRSSIKLQEFAKLCMLLLEKKLHDLIFMERLAVDLGLMMQPT